ncbi:hypothetical protein BGW80DRAFT_1307469 [Lactifluus volemus]|nr:hypothetical protein BGW80DRAFT_1307469 [Lactifluus volemus]
MFLVRWSVWWLMVQIGAQILHCGQVASGAGWCVWLARAPGRGLGRVSSFVGGIEILGCLVVAYAR